MKIQHLRSNQIYELPFKEWLEDYVSKGLDIDYKVLQKDTVYLMQVNEDGSKKHIGETEKVEALKLVKESPLKFDFLPRRFEIAGVAFDPGPFINLEYDDFINSHIHPNVKKNKSTLDEAFKRITGNFVPNTKTKVLKNRSKSTIIPEVYKLSIGPGAIGHEMYEELIKDNYVTVHSSTGALWSSKKTQFEVFSSARPDDYFYLCRGNQEVVFLAQFTNDPLIFSNKEGYKGWGLRKFRLVQESSSNNGYAGADQKWWTPNHNSTFHKIPNEEYALADELIFKPFFGARIGDLMHVKINYPVLEDYNSIREDSPLEGQNEQNQGKATFLIESGTSFSITDNVDGVIGVKQQAQELSELLIDLKDEKGMMVGVFGRWGRGKTKLWEEVKKYISAKDQKAFECVEFHAWKYQDTPASWAYLYELITETCLLENGKHKVLGINVIDKLSFRLNILKHGWGPLILFSVTFILFFIWTFLIGFNTKISWLVKLIGLVTSGSISLGMIYGMFKLYKRILPKAIDLFKKYSKIKTFKDHLGLQSEIQEELIRILEADESLSPNRRILLFVDDIDRCSEERIISIVDSLKVMLDDRYISKRLVVLTAVDERVLKRAIHRKYFDSIKNDYDENPIEKRRTIRLLIREYLDKLFISGIKLTELSLGEREEIFDAFCDGKVKPKEEKEITPNLTKNSADSMIDFDGVTPEIEDLNKQLDEFQKLQVGNFEVKGALEFVIGDTDFEIEHLEYIILKKSLADIASATPRAIRIFYYRYLLGKRLFSHQIPLNSAISSAWHYSNYKEIFPRLIAYYGSEMSPIDLADLRLNLEAIDTNEYILEIYSDEYVVNRKVLIEVLKVVQMVVTY